MFSREIRCTELNMYSSLVVEVALLFFLLTQYGLLFISVNTEGIDQIKKSIIYLSIRTEQLTPTKVEKNSIRNSLGKK